MKKLLGFIVIVIMMVMFGFQPKVLAGVDTNVCVITEFDYNYNLNGTNCIAVKVVYPVSWPTWSLVTSTNLLSGNAGWYEDTTSSIGMDRYAFGELPRWRKWYIKKDVNTHRYFGVWTNQVTLIKK